MEDKLSKILLIVLMILGLYLMFDGITGILERDRQQTEHIKLLEQSLNEQIQEKQVYMNMLEVQDE